MTRSQIEVITSVERRRRWTAAEKERLVAASLEPGAVVSSLAREAGVRPSQLYAWRRALGARRGPARADFAAVRIASDPVTAAARLTAAPAAAAAAAMPDAARIGGVIEIELANGARMRINGVVDAGTLAAAVEALGRKDRPR